MVKVLPRSVLGALGMLIHWQVSDRRVEFALFRACRLDPMNADMFQRKKLYDIPYLHLFRFCSSLNSLFPMATLAALAGAAAPDCADMFVDGNVFRPNIGTGAFG
ncbi:MAG TPA: hypothetical protein VGD58_24350 [Herpetosiphonaceae bacterium]